MCIPWIWQSITTMVVDDSIIGDDLTSTQVISVPLWLPVTGEISNLDDTGLPSAEILEIVIFTVKLSNTWRWCASEESLAEMPWKVLWPLLIRGKCHPSVVPVILHVTSSLSPTHTWAILKGDNITAPELSKSFRDSIHNKNPKFISTTYLVRCEHNCISVLQPCKGLAKLWCSFSKSVDSIHKENLMANV